MKPSKVRKGNDSRENTKGRKKSTHNFYNLMLIQYMIVVEVCLLLFNKNELLKSQERILASVAPSAIPWKNKAD